MRKIVDYYRRWLQVAIWHAYGRADFIAGLLGIFGPPILRWFSVKNADTLMGTLAWQIPLSCFVTLAIVRLIGAPYWMHQEEEKKRAEVEAERAQLMALMDDRNRRAQVKESLGSLLKEGHELLGARPKTDQEYAEWRTQADQWLNRTANDIAQRLSPADRDYFLAICPTMSEFLGSYNREHNSCLMNINAFLMNLKRLYERAS